MALAFGALSLAIARGTPGNGFAGSSLWSAAAALAAGWALIAVGLIAWARRPTSRFGLLLAAGGFAWFLLEWNNPGIGSALAFAIGLVLYAVCPPLIAHAALAYPSGRLSGWPDRAGLATAYMGACLVLGLLPALVFDPGSQGCSQCPRNLLLVRDDPDLFSGLNRVGVQLGLGWSLALIVLLAVQLARSTPALVRLRMPVAAAAAAYLGLVAWDFQHSLDRGTLGSDATDRRLWLGQAAALLALARAWPGAGCAAAAPGRAVARLVVELAASPAPGGLRDVLAEHARRPVARARLPARRRAARGCPADARSPSGARSRRWSAAGGQVAFLAHRARAARRSGARRRGRRRLAAGAGERAAPSRAGGAAAGPASLSRPDRPAGDAERWRLERDLHDGAQQRLVGLSLSLRLARSGSGPTPTPSLAPWIDKPRASSASPSGSFGSSRTGSSRPCLPTRASAAAWRRSPKTPPVPIRLTALPEGRLEPAVETAAYFVVAEAGQAQHGERVSRSMRTRRDGRLVSRSRSTATPPEELIDLEDRVGALDGRLEVLA